MRTCIVMSNSSDTFKIESVVVADPRMDVRTTLRESLKEMGIAKIEANASIKEIWSALEQSPEAPDWIICSVDLTTVPNTFHLLDLFLREPRFAKTRVSLILNEDQADLIPTFFEFGVVSYHMTPFTKASILRDLQKLVAALSEGVQQHSFVAASYLRDYMMEIEEYDKLIQLEEKLITQYPGKPDLYIKLAEAYVTAEKEEEAAKTLWQAKFMGADLTIAIKQLQDLIEAESIDAHGGEGQSIDKLFGVKTVTIVDSDESAGKQLGAIVEKLGATAEVLSSGADALAKLKENKPSLIIMEWKLPKLPGAAFLQRLHQDGHADVPVIVASAQVQDKDKLLLKELGVLALLSKPLHEDVATSELMNAFKNFAFASTFDEMLRQVRQAVLAGSLENANKALEKLKVTKGTPKHMVWLAESEIAYAQEDYEVAKKKALDAFREGGENIIVLNILGKSYLKVGDNEGAMKCLNRANQLSASNLDRLCTTAEVASELGDVEGAESLLETAESVDADSDMVKKTSAKVALNNGKPGKAKKLMESMESMKSIVVYMNNRAVMMVREKNFPDAIKLYEDAVASLPDKSAREKASVRYNLGLAYARAGSLGKAIESLKEIKEEDNPALFPKANSLATRIEQAQNGGKKLTLSEPSIKMAVPKKKEDELYRPTATHASPGELCLHLIFFSETHPDEVQKTLQRKYPFRKRAKSVA